MNSSKPVVSVLLPIYNAFPWLPRTVESILGQTDPRWILYAINDGSTDESAEYLDQLDDPRVVVIHQQNQGLSATLNYGLDMCETKYIARMDADDVCHPQRFEKQVQYLEAHPRVGLLGSQIRRMGAVRTDSGSRLPTSHDGIVAALMAGQHAICHPSIMCRKEAFDQVGRYRDFVGEDWDMYLRFAETWQVANHPEALLNYRYHSSSINGARMAELRKRIRYHCESARRRGQGLADISYEEFTKQEQADGKIRQWLQLCEDHSRARYHAAMVDILGERPVRGWTRLGVAAAMAPHLTVARLLRRLGRSDSSVAQAGHA